MLCLCSSPPDSSPPDGLLERTSILAPNDATRTGARQACAGFVRTPPGRARIRPAVGAETETQIGTHQQQSRFLMRRERPHPVSTSRESHASTSSTFTCLHVYSGTPLSAASGCCNYNAGDAEAAEAFLPSSAAASAASPVVSGQLIKASSQFARALAACDTEGW